MRKEKDLVGFHEIPEDALYGIHSIRARENFTYATPFNKHWYVAMGMVKKAVYQCYKEYKRSALKTDQKFESYFFSDEILEALLSAADEVIQCKHYNWFIVPALQGGAGTSINMNVNEIIANASLTILGRKPGEYHFIHPLQHANIFQSTNDVVPTALRVAVMQLLKELEQSINRLRIEVEQKEKETHLIVRLGYTQMQAALPTTYGRLFSAYSDALSRDWWRVSKCFERIKVVNLGGGAIGTSLSVPRFIVMEVVGYLQRLTNLPITRAENHADATSNLDSLVEVHAILKAHAVNLEKIASDLRLLAADVSGNPDISLPAEQTGSSMMPGKVNPVISEYVISIAHKVYTNDQLITSLCAQGCLELNAYLPIIGDAMLESIQLLVHADEALAIRMINGIQINPAVALEKAYKAPAITTVLLPLLGYDKATEIAVYMKTHSVSILEANEKMNFIDMKKLTDLLSTESLQQQGFRLSDFTKANYNE